MGKLVISQSSRSRDVTATRPRSLAEVARQAISKAQNQGLLICDVSGSMDMNDAPGRKRRIDALREVVSQLRHRFPALRIVAFSSQPMLVSLALPEPGGNTALHLALDFAAPLARPNEAVCLITDGEPDDEAAALAAARRFGRRIEVFYVGPEGGRGQRFLSQLAAITGGAYQRATLGQDLLEKTEKVLALPPGS